MLAYAYETAPDETDDGEARTMLWFPDLPGSVTEGGDPAEAVAHALDALIVLLDGYMDAGRDIPPPSPPAGRPVVPLPTRVAMQVNLYRAMREAGVSRTELARRLGKDERQVRRMLDLFHRAWPDELDAAFAALGRQVHVAIQPIAA